MFLFAWLHRGNFSDKRYRIDIEMQGWDEDLFYKSLNNSFIIIALSGIIGDNR